MLNSYIGNIKMHCKLLGSKIYFDGIYDMFNLIVIHMGVIAESCV